MKLLIFTLVILAVVITATLAAVSDPGYVLITRNPWSVELSLTFFVVLAIVAFVVAYAALRLAIRLWQSPAQVARWRQRKRRQQARAAQVRGLTLLIEGRWAEAERHLLSHIHDSGAPLIGYLGAAVAAQERDDLEKRDQYLSAAHQSAPAETVAIGVTQAALQTRSNQSERALATLTRLHGRAPRNGRVLAMLVGVYRRLRDWQGVASLLGALRKYKVFDDDEMDELESATYHALLRAAGTNGGPDSAVRLWEQTIPKALRREPELIEAYARKLIEQDDHERAEALLRKTVNHKWEPTLVYLYGVVQLPAATEQLKVAERWLPDHPYSPNLLLTCGRLALRSKIWGKARGYLESAVAANARAEAYRELGGLLEQLGEEEKAMECYRDGLGKAVSSMGEG